MAKQIFISILLYIQLLYYGSLLFCIIIILLTSSNGHPLDRNTVWDCRINNFNSLSFISASCVGFVRIIVIFNVTLDVNSPRISLTDINVLSVILSSGSGFQFLIIIAPIQHDKSVKKRKERKHK